MQRFFSSASSSQPILFFSFRIFNRDAAAARLAAAHLGAQPSFIKFSMAHHSGFQEQ
jgi:hypothetical protein